MTHVDRLNVINLDGNASSPRFTLIDSGPRPKLKSFTKLYILK